MLAKLPVRGEDVHGAGHYQASRGDRRHNGVDLACYPGSEILSISHGIVTRFGYPYADHLEYRYVEVTDQEGLRLRYFYVTPYTNLATGDKVKPSDVLGIVQDLGKIYEGITNHVHFEVRQSLEYEAQHGKEYLDPTDFI